MSNNEHITRLTGEFQELTTGEFKTSARVNTAKEHIILAQDMDIVILTKEQATQLIVCIANTLYGNA